jgi:Zn-dependent M28 family amino/carboxypeptidase
VDLDNEPMFVSPDGTGANPHNKPVLVNGVALHPPGNLNDFNPPLVIFAAYPTGGAAPWRSSDFLQPASEPLDLWPMVSVWDPAVLSALTSGVTDVKVSAHIPAAIAEPVNLRNVVGMLRGSDPALKDTCLVLSAHYDHLGVRADGADRIYNGANDDASGVATVIEAAAALAALPSRPKRSIVFVALFGEEVGEIGSRYYVQHPVFPAAKTIADVNLEQLGRTDDSEGPRVGQFNLTGFDFTTMAPVFRQAAEDAGVHAVKDERNGDAYFARSDNAMFAGVGIPSTTVSVAYEFPDYHGVGDEWPKLDYGNMAKVGSAIALAAFRLADSAEAPRWNPENHRTTRYIKAR